VCSARSLRTRGAVAEPLLGCDNGPILSDALYAKLRMMRANLSNKNAVIQLSQSVAEIDWKWYYLIPGRRYRLMEVMDTSDNI
jgi:hypothetical protein